MAVLVALPAREVIVTLNFFPTSPSPIERFFFYGVWWLIMVFFLNILKIYILKIIFLFLKNYF
jgi:hypothetical protein